MDRSDARNRQLRWSSVLGLGLRGAGMAMALVSQIVLARLMPAHDFGLYVVVVAWATILASIASCGLPFAAVRFLPLYRDREDWATLRGFAAFALAGCLGGVLIASLGFLLWSGFDPMLSDHRATVLSGLWLIAPLSLSGLMTTWMQAALRPLRAEALSNLLRPALVVTLVGMGAMAQGGTVDSTVALCLSSLAGLLALVPAAVNVARDLPRPLHGAWRCTPWRSWLSSGIALMLPMLSMMTIERVDTIILGAYAGPEAAGIYSVAARLAQMTGLALVSVNALMGPMAAELHGRGDHAGLRRLLANAAAMNLLLAGAMVGFLLLLGPWVLGLFGAVFTDGAGVMRILMVGQVAQAVLGSAAGLLGVTGHNRPVLIVLPLAVVVHAALCLWLIPGLGAEGAAIAGATTLAALSLVMTLIAWRVLGIDTSILGAARRLLDRARAPAPG